MREKIQKKKIASQPPENPANLSSKADLQPPPPPQQPLPEAVQAVPVELDTQQVEETQRVEETGPATPPPPQDPVLEIPSISISELTGSQRQPVSPANVKEEAKDDSWLVQGIGSWEVQ